MLTGLQLRNIALIDSLELVFQAGFTVLTGETGAGKSILLDALDAVLGGAQGAAGLRLLRPGCDLSRIEASFEITEPVGRWLSREGLADDGQDELIVSREWRRQQPERVTSRSRLNGVAVNRQQLQDLRPLLIDLTIQGQTQQLSRSGQQRRWLDRLGGAGLAECSQEVRTAWQLWREAAASGPSSNSCWISSSRPAWRIRMSGTGCSASRIGWFTGFIFSRAWLRCSVVYAMERIRLRLSRITLQR